MNATHAAATSTRLPQEVICIVDVDDTLDDVEKAMSTLGRCVAAVTANGRFVGFVSAHTLLAEIERSMDRLFAGEGAEEDIAIGSLLSNNRETLVA